MGCFIFESASSRLCTALPSEISEIKSKPQIIVFYLYVKVELLTLQEALREITATETLRRSLQQPPCLHQHFCFRSLVAWDRKRRLGCIVLISNVWGRETNSSGEVQALSWCLRGTWRGHDTYVQGIFSSLRLWSTVKADKAHWLGRQEDRTKERNMV